VVDDVVPDVYYGVAWANDGATVFFTRPDDAMRPWQVWRHELRTPTSDDVLVFQEDDDRFYVAVGRTRSGQFVEITTASKVTSEVWLIDADEPASPAVVVEPREQGHEYHVEHHGGPGGDRLFVLTNADGAENFALMVTEVATPGRASWSMVLPHRDDTRLDDVDAFARFLVVSERADAVERLRVLMLADDGASRTTTCSRCPSRCTRPGWAAIPTTTPRRCATSTRRSCHPRRRTTTTPPLAPRH